MKEHEHRKEVLANLRSMKPEELAAREEALAEELFWLEFKKRGGQLDKPASIRKTRRGLARVKTLRAERNRKTTEVTS